MNMSHDLQCSLYLVLLYDVIHFNEIECTGVVMATPGVAMAMAGVTMAMSGRLCWGCW